MYKLLMMYGGGILKREKHLGVVLLEIRLSLSDKAPFKKNQFENFLCPIQDGLVEANNISLTAH